jgi:transposase InsO family protein
MVSPSARQMALTQLVRDGHCSQRRACRLLGVARSTARYEQAQRLEDGALLKRIKELAHLHRRYGYRRVSVLLCREGLRVNVKRVHRLWKEAGLGLPKKRPKRRQYGPKGAVVNKAQHPNHVWSYDFVEDRTAKGGRLKILAVVDEYTRECLALHVDKRITSQGVLCTLEWLFLLHGRPGHIRSDNGPEFVAKAVQQWIADKGSSTLYIHPGSPWENAYIESFNDKFRDECLNMEVFKNGQEAREVIEAWRIEYNEVRPHSSLNYQTPAHFAAQCRNSRRPTASLRCSTAHENLQSTMILST